MFSRARVRARAACLTRVNPLAPNPRARARARRWRRELGGGVRQHPGSNNCVEGPALTRSRRILARARRARRWRRELGGDVRQHPGSNNYPVDVTRAESSCARGAPTQRRRSAAARPTFRWSAERPAKSRRLGGASAIPFLGRTMELGRSRRTLMMSVAAGRAARFSEPRGHGKQAALKDQRYRAPLTLLAPNPRARGARRPSDVGQQQRDPHSGGQQSDPRVAPAGRRFGNFVFGANDGARAFAANADDECGRRPRRALDLSNNRKQGDC